MLRRRRRGGARRSPGGSVPEGGLLACLGFVIAGTAVRLVVEVAPFFLGTLLIGVGIAVANVLVADRDQARLPAGRDDE